MALAGLVEGASERWQTDTLACCTSAPLGQLPAGEYTLDLYDAKAEKVTAARTSMVVH